MPKKGPRPGSPEFGMRAHERRANIQAGNVFPKKKAAPRPAPKKTALDLAAERKRKVEEAMKY